MEKIAQEHDFLAFKLAVGEQLNMSSRPLVDELRPIECYIKPDADVNDKPGLIFVLVDRYGREYMAQISQRMFQPVVTELEIMRG